MSVRLECKVCNRAFTRKFLLNQHLNTKKHKKLILENATSYKCDCGKIYFHKKSLKYHQNTCNVSKSTESNLQRMQQRLDDFEKERDELRSQIALLLDKHACQPTMTNNNHNNNTQNIDTQNIDTQNNIHIHINAFGHENLEYLDKKDILECISRVYKSVPALLEKIHFDPNHPENHNIKITNRKLPYAEVMDTKQKWKTMNKKEAIESMVINGYNFLDENYDDVKVNLSSSKKQGFEGFQDKMNDQDPRTMKQIKSDVEIMVMNGPPVSPLEEPSPPESPSVSSLESSSDFF